MTAPDEDGVLIIDEHGDRKWGTKTAHVGRQYLANLGKVDLGVVSVSSLWADERVYCPVDIRPYTPALHFAAGRSDPAFQTKFQLATRLVQQAQQRKLPFRAVVADCTLRRGPPLCGQPRGRGCRSRARAQDLAQLVAPGG